MLMQQAWMGGRLCGQADKVGALQKQAAPTGIRPDAIHGPNSGNTSRG